jgi:hypothetical protein
MVPVTTSIEDLLKQFSGVLPVDKLSKPTVFSGLGTTLQPVLTFEPSPLASQLLRLEIFSAGLTLVGGQTLASFSSGNVPNGEVHRYQFITVQHGSGAPTNFTLKAIYRSSTQLQVGIGVIAHVDVKPDVPQNLLGTYGTTAALPLSWNGSPLDLYPGSFWQINNTQGLDVLTTLTCTGVRLVLRGPNLDFGAIVNSEINSSGA